MFGLINKFKKNPAFATFCMLLFGILYLIFGAAIFMFIEKENEEKGKVKLLADEKILILRYNITGNDYTLFKSIILDLEQHRNGIQWSFTGSLYFAITVVTAIGYGHSVPQTTMGKEICIAYTVFGIPLWFIIFQMLADSLNLTAARGMKYIGKKFGSTKGKVTKMHLRVFGIFSSFFTVLIGVFSFASFENWSYLESTYYCLMTLTTIGFGDYVALQENNALQQDTFYIIFSFVYIIAGLTVFAATLNLFIFRFESSNTSSKNDAEDREISENENDTLKKEKEMSFDSEGKENSSYSEENSNYKNVLLKLINVAKNCFPTCSRLFCKTKSYNINAIVEIKEKEVNNNRLFVEKYQNTSNHRLFYATPKFEENLTERNNIPSRFTNIDFCDDCKNDSLSEASYSTESTSCPTPDMSRRTNDNEKPIDSDFTDQDGEKKENNEKARNNNLMTENKIEQIREKAQVPNLESGPIHFPKGFDESKIHIENELSSSANAKKMFFRNNRALLERACSHSSSLITKNISYHRMEDIENSNICSGQNKQSFGSQQPKLFHKQVSALVHENRPRAWSDSTFRAHHQVTRTKSTKPLPKSNLTRFRDRNRSTAEDIKKKANSN